jgi:hypothetical protein
LLHIAQPIKTFFAQLTDFSIYFFWGGGGSFHRSRTPMVVFNTYYICFMFLMQMKTMPPSCNKAFQATVEGFNIWHWLKVQKVCNASLFLHFDSFKLLLLETPLTNVATMKTNELQL